MSGKTVPKESKKLPDEFIKKLINLYQTTKITQRDLGKKFNISKSRIQRILKANKVSIRTEIDEKLRKSFFRLIL